MKNNEFKTLVAELKAELATAKSVEEVNAIEARYVYTNVTDKQYSAITSICADRFIDLADETGVFREPAKKPAKKMSKRDFSVLVKNVTDKIERAVRATRNPADVNAISEWLDVFVKSGKYEFTAEQNEVLVSLFEEMATKCETLAEEIGIGVTLTDAEFEQIVEGYRKTLEKATTVKECEDACKCMHSLYEGARAVTPAMLEVFDNMAYERADVLIEHDTAVKMAKVQKGSGKHMSNKNEGNKPAEQPTAPVEVLKGEVIDTKTEKEVNAAIGRISAKVEKIGKGYLDIVGDVARLRALKAWKITGHKSMYDLCADKFGMSRATVGNLEAIFAKYGDKETYKLTDEAEGLSVRQMLANIKSEKAAELEDKGGESEDGESNGNGGKSGKGGKIETLTNLSIQLGADWSIEEILEEIKAQLTEQKAVYPEGATLTLTITK